MKAWLSAPRTRTFLLAIAAAAVLIGLVAVGRAGGFKLLVSASLDTTEERAEFLRSCGWEVDAASEQAQVIHIPETFSVVYENYNELQRQQGFDLAPYRGEDCTLYTYTVTNYPDDTQTVTADLYLYKNRVIAGDVHSTSLNGFMVGVLK